MFSHKVISRSFIVLCLIFAVLLGAIIYVVRERTSQIINQLSIDRVLASKQGFDNYLDDLSDSAMMRGTVLANQERLISAIREYEENNFELTDENYEYIVSLLNEFLYGLDFISVTDRNGIALARTDNGERDYPLPKNGYNLRATPEVAHVLDTGEQTVSLAFMLDNTTLVASTAYPIFDGDELIGLITCLCDLTNPKYINAFKEQSGSEVAIFLGQEEFISTLTYSSNPVRLVAGDAVIEAIFEHREDSYVSFSPLGGTTYGTIFSPLIYRGEIIGMVFNGVDVHEALAIRTEMDMYIALIVALALIIVTIFIVVIYRYNDLIKRQMGLQNLMTHISQSFLSADDLDMLISKAFYELGPQMKVSQILLYKSKPEDPTKFVCSNEWIDPWLNLSTRIGNELEISPELSGAYVSLRGNDKFYISSDDREISKILLPYRVNFVNFLSTAIFLDDQVYAVVDFSRAKARGRWSKDDINVASFVANILTGAFHRKRIAEQLVSAKDIAERNSKYKSAFLANVSHEIRTPMNAILGITEIYLQDPKSRTNLDEGLGIIYDSGSLLLGIINDVLDLSKIEAGKLEILPTRYDIPSLINDTVQICRLRYGSKPIEFTLDIDKNTPLNLIGDELRIRQVLNNILSNAFKYTSTGEIKMSVSADKTKSSGKSATHEESDNNVTLIFRVKDTGQGMTSEQLDMLFDEFTRFNMDMNRTTVGAGLGMSITKQLLDLMGGDIYVESHPGKGTTFTVHLPQKRVDTTVCGPDMSEKLNSFSFRSMSVTKKAQIICEYMPYGSVLVVDDVESNLYVAKGMLIPYGLKIETATSGYETIEYIANGKTYDVIFMDHMMPKMDGIETVKNLRQMGYTGYIIALTANALVGQAEIFLENGFDGYIPKPIDTRELNTALNEFIRNKKPQSVVNAAREEAREAELLRALEAGDNSKGTAKKAEKKDISAADLSDVEECFIMDAENIIYVLEEELGHYEKGEEVDIDMYRISVHGVKSALRHIGEDVLSELAYELEKAATATDLDTIIAKTPELIYALKSLIAKLRK